MIKCVNIATGRKEVDKYTSEDIHKTINNSKGNTNTDVSRRKTQDKLWWDAECETVVEDRKNKLKTWRRTGVMNDFIAYKKARAFTAKTIRSKKKESYLNFVQSINKHTNKRFMWNKVKILKTANNRIHWNRWPKGDREKAVQKEIDKISPPWAETYKNKIPFNHDNDPYSLNERFSLDELKRAIGKLKISTSPGLDHVENEMIR